MATINPSSGGLILTTLYYCIQAWERPLAISAGTMRQISWRCTRGTSSTGPWRRRTRGWWAGQQSAGSSAQLGRTVRGDSASVTQVSRLYLYSLHSISMTACEWNLSLIGVSQLTSLPPSFSLLTLIIMVTLALARRNRGPSRVHN